MNGLKDFLKSKSFLWMIHALVVSGGAYLSYKSGKPLPLVVTGAINAVMGSPFDTKINGNGH
jgi:hypothetical protein